jgi:myo-inositol-1(or 4)-monophosphatase
MLDTSRIPGPPEDPGLLAELVDLAQRLARSGGELVRAGGEPRVEATKSSPTDVVTAMDRAVERYLRGGLAAASPHDAQLGEESGGSSGRTGLTWVVDPIDGTVNYLYGLPEHAVSVAVVRGDPSTPGAWWPLAGCVHQPMTGRTWTAVRGGGAFEDGRRLCGPSRVPLESALVATGFGYRPQQRAAQAQVLTYVLPRVRDIRRMGAASLDLCAVAAGRVDAYYERGLNVWDMAAAALVVTEAGGRLSGLDSAPPGPDMVVAAAAPVLPELLGLLIAAGARATTAGRGGR